MKNAAYSLFSIRQV